MEGIQTGQVCWLEVPVTDVARASHFYTAVLGWESDATGAGTPSNLAGTKTVHFFQKGVMHGAFHLRDAAGVDVARPGSVTTFLVDSIDDTLAKAEAAGGKAVITKTEIGGGMGFFARFTDSEGNVQGIFQKA